VKRVRIFILLAAQFLRGYRSVVEICSLRCRRQMIQQALFNRVCRYNLQQLLGVPCGQCGAAAGQSRLQF
jgi:hypothetical protein